MKPYTVSYLVGYEKKKHPTMSSATVGRKRWQGGAIKNRLISNFLGVALKILKCQPVDRGPGGDLML